MNPRPENRLRQCGIVLLVLLIALALMAIAVAGAADWWAQARQREAEAELLYAGDQYRKAIERYYYATPAAVKVFPTSLEDLLEDPRFPVPVRHLRRLYQDPVSGDAFEVLRVGQEIIGVASRSTLQPVKRRNFPAPYGGFAEQDSYQQWKFVFTPVLRGQPGAAARPKLPGNNQVRGARS